MKSKKEQVTSIKPWAYYLHDVLWILYKGVEQPARVAGYLNSQDDTTPLLVNIRVSDGLRWGERKIRIQPEQILRADPEWEARRHAQWEADLKQHCDEVYAKMTPGEKAQLAEQARRRQQRSPFDILIDRACGID